MVRAPVAKGKNNPPQEPGKTPSAPGAPAEKFTEPVKLRLTFKKRLQRVADAADVEMGDLIESQMKAFIDREVKRLAEEDLRESGD